MAKKRALNPYIIGRNLDEAIEELTRTRQRVASGEILVEQLQVGLAHAYHHINFAWNARFASTEAYAHLTKAQFNRWGKFPTNIDD